ncbi:hypothetical protein D3C87_552170 [compost metagenome]
MITKQRKYLDATYDKVSDLSFHDKQQLSTNALREHFVNHLLDRLLELKKAIGKKTKEVDSVVEMIEKLTWMEVDEAGLKIVNIIISLTRDWSKNLRNFDEKCLETLSVDSLPSELSHLILSLDDLDEAADSLENRFFAHPNDAEMKGISDELSALFKK